MTGIEKKLNNEGGKAEERGCFDQARIHECPQTNRQRFNYFHAPTYALVSYIIKPALIIYIKTLYSLIAPTCFDS
jgi:hypothetical protein